MNATIPELNQARVYSVPLNVSDSQYADCESSLNAEELARANRFVHADVRRRFVVCRGTLRSVLAQMVGCTPSAVTFRYEQWGKPQLAKPRVPNLHFNVSHSGEWALIAIAQSPLGVDVEVINSRITYRAIAAQILSPGEQQSWEQLSSAHREEATLKLWVCKEALLKAMGLGIAEGLKQVTLPLPLNDHGEFAPLAIDGNLQMHLEDDGSCRTNHWIDSAAWRLRLLPLIPDSYAALCTARPIDTVLLD